MRVCVVDSNKDRRDSLAAIANATLATADSVLVLGKGVDKSDLPPPEVLSADVLLHHVGRGNDEYADVVDSYLATNSAGLVVLFSGAGVSEAASRYAAVERVCAVLPQALRQNVASFLGAAVREQTASGKLSTDLLGLLDGRDATFEATLQFLEGCMPLQLLWFVAGEGREGLKHAAQAAASDDAAFASGFEETVLRCLAEAIMTDGRSLGAHAETLARLRETAVLDRRLATCMQRTGGQGSGQQATSVQSLIRELATCSTTEAWQARLLSVRDALLTP